MGPTGPTGSASSATLNVVQQNNDYTIQVTDDVIIADGGNTYTLPLASAAGEGKTIYIYVTADPALTLRPATGNGIWNLNGVRITTSATFYNGIFICDGVNDWYEMAQ